MTRLKKRKARFRMASRMRILVSVQVLLNDFRLHFHSLQPAAGQLDEDIFERRRKHFQALQFVVFSFELLHERDDRLRRTRGVQHVGAVEFAAVGDAFERLQHAVCRRPGQADFDARVFRRSVVSVRAACRSR